MMRHFGGFLNSVREFLKGTAEMHLAKLLHHKSDFEVVPDIKETADKQMLPRMSWDLTSCPGLGTKSRQQISQWLKINKTYNCTQLNYNCTQLNTTALN